MTATEFWKKKFDEYPQTDAEKLAVAMMQEYAIDSYKNAYNAGYEDATNEANEEIEKNYTANEDINYRR